VALLSAHNLSCVKRDRVLFENLELSVDAGELLYIKGPNGAGKTSLLRILVGLSEAACGEVRFDGEALSRVRDKYHGQLVYFGHKLGLNQNLTALENLHYWCLQHGQSQSESQYYHLLDRLSLVGLEELPVGNLSAGQQRRVALARLWLKPDAKLWVLDEPFTALDVQGISLLKTRIRQHLKVQGTVIMTSHQSLELDYPTRELVLEYKI
jgi:heme exporter protein A